MSRRWYRNGSQVVFVGWEPTEQAFYVNVVNLCEMCGGSGEVDASEEVCPACGGEGMHLAGLSPSARTPGLTLDQVAALLSKQGLPFPDFVRSDLDHDRQANDGSLLREYELET
jgi:hypothetical protein